MYLVKFWLTITVGMVTKSSGRSSAPDMRVRPASVLPTWKLQWVVRVTVECGGGNEDSIRHGGREEGMENKASIRLGKWVYSQVHGAPGVTICVTAVSF